MTSSDRCLRGAETDSQMWGQSHWEDATHRVRSDKVAQVCVTGGALLPEAGYPLSTSSRRLGAGLLSEKKSGQTKFWKPEAIDEIIKLDEIIRKGAYIEQDQEYESAGNNYI